ncbi:MAG: DsbA family oxidoreductase [Eggerthellaceae bacterium]|jgi:predicted DsbA family dithiol-disulfide isomerase
MHITFWSDFVCPHSYLGAMRLLKALDSLNIDEPVELEMKSFELDPYAHADKRVAFMEDFSRLSSLDDMQTFQQLDEMNDMAQSDGIPFNFMTAVSCSSFDAHRLFQFAKTQGHADLGFTFMRAMFERNLVLNDPETLVELATSEGLDEQEVRDVLSSRAFEREVRVDETQAVMNKIDSAPFYVINNTYSMSGAQPYDDVRFMVAKAYLASHPDVAVKDLLKKDAS